MAFQRYPLPTVQKVSQLIRDTLVLPLPEQSASGSASTLEDDKIPDSLDALGDLFRVGDDLDQNLPAPNTEGRWFVSTLDPSEALGKLPGLWLAPGIRLVTYLRQDGEGGMGATVALPGLLSTTERLEEAINKAAADQPPTPMGTLPNLMGGIEGDGSRPRFWRPPFLFAKCESLAVLAAMRAGLTIALWRQFPLRCLGNGAAKCRRISRQRSSCVPIQR